MKVRPLCQDGRACGNKNEAIMLATFEGGKKFVCGKCYLVAEKEAKEAKFKEVVKEILEEKGIIS